MYFNPYEAEIMMKEHVKDALRDPTDWSGSRSGRLAWLAGIPSLGLRLASVKRVEDDLSA